MLKAIYTPMSGALAQEKVLDIIANNLANVNTVGYKGDSVTFKLLDPEPEKNYKTPLPPANFKIDLEKVMPLKGNDIAYVGIADIERDEAQGPAIQTNNDSDVMIEGNGMLAVNTPDGIRYSRNGQLSVSPDGVLVTNAGNPILGEKGNIVLKAGKFEINQRGEIYQNNQLVDKLQLYTFKDHMSIERAGMNLWQYQGPDEGRELVKDPSVKQGYLEGSNVSAIKNLTSMIIAHRSYESYQKAISNYDKMMEISNNQLGAVHA